MGSRAILVVGVILSLLILPVAYADFIDTSASRVITANGTVNITGYVRYTNLTGIPAYLMNATVNGTTNLTNTSSSGGASLLLGAPPIPGDYNISITTNGSLTRSIPIHVTNFTSANMTFHGIQPPFVNGSTFTINVTTTGNGTALPSIQVFKSFGQYLSWNITNLTAVNYTNGIFQYNITIPGEADGDYIISFEKGLAKKVFNVRSTLLVIADMLDTENATTTNIAQDTNATIRARVRDSSGPITTANVTAYVTLPNGTVVNITLTHSSTTNGTYTGTLSDTYTSTDGRYDVRIDAETTRNISSSTFTDVAQLESKLDTDKDFFFEFGGDSAFAAGGQIAFNVLVYNLSNNIIFDGSATNGVDKTICTNTTSTIHPIELRNTRTGLTYTFDTTNLTVSTGNFFGQTVCKINFTAPSENGIYTLKVNSTTNVSGTFVNSTAVGSFSVQKYILKVSPVSTLGGGFEFLHSLKPGDNATFEIGARDLNNSGNAVSGVNITNITARRIISLNFFRREADITNITNVSSTAGTTSTNPKEKILLPVNRTGPFQIEYSALINHSTGQDEITGKAFYFAKYVEGFAYPGDVSFGGPAEGGGGGFEAQEAANSFFQCSGAQSFTAMVKDVKTRQAARNVIFNSIEAAREEETGKDVSAFVKLLNSTLSDSNGQANLTVNFSSSTTYSGFYFFMLNITTDDGNNDILPGGFECRNLEFFANVRPVGSTGGFNAAPDAILNVSINSIKNIAQGGNTARSGNVTVTKLESFDPKRGPAFYTPTSTVVANLTNGTVNFTVNASAFGLTTWPSGFNMLRITVVDNATGGVNTSGTGDGFFHVVAFDVYTDFSFNTYFPSQSVTINVSARTNVTHNHTNVNGTYSFGTADGGFMAEIGRPWEGSLVNVTSINATLISDNWNSSENKDCWDCFEKWAVTMQIPSGVRKGFNMIIVTVKSNITNLTANVEIPSQVNKYTVTVPDEEGFFMQNFSVLAVSQAHNDSIYDVWKVNLTDVYADYGVRSLGGGVCIAENFTTQRFGMNSINVNYSNSNAPAGNYTAAVVLDNGTAGVFDTLIINTSSGTAVVNITNRSLAPAGMPGLFLRDIMDCGFVSVLNATVSSSGFGSGFGGQHQIRTDFYVPFIVKQASTAVSGATVNITQIIKQEDAGGSGGRGGFGFSDFVTRYNVTVGTTDSSGVAFVRLNVNDSGPMNMIWKLTNGADTDTAEFFNGVPFEVKSFKTWGGIANNSFRIVNLTYSATETRNATVSGSPIYYGTYDESASGELVNSSSAATVYHIALRNVSQSFPGAPMTPISNAINNFTELIIDDDGDFTLSATDTGQSPVARNWTQQFGQSDFGSTITRTVDGNMTGGTLGAADSSVAIIFGDSNPGFDKFLPNNGSSTKVQANISVRVCGFTYDQPEMPIIGGSVLLTTENFTNFGPPQTINLTMYDPYNGTATDTILTGPSGCASFNVTRPGGWVSGFGNNIQGTITSGSDTENVYVGNVFVSCPASGSCFSFSGGGGGGG